MLMLISCLRCCNNCVGWNAELMESKNEVICIFGQGILKFGPLAGCICSKLKYSWGISGTYLQGMI